MQAVLQHAAFAVAVIAVAGLGLLATVCGFIVFVRGTTRNMASASKRLSKAKRTTLIVFGIIGTIYGGYKMSLKNRSSADESIVLQQVVAINTNGVTTISATSTGASAEPMYYRDTVTNGWTLATEDGFWHDYSGTVNGVYSNAWSRSEEEFTPKAMYWFGDYPPPVEIVVEDGVFMDAWRGSGVSVEVDWRIADEVEITEGTKLILEYGVRNALFGTAAEQELTPEGGRSGTIAVQGWFLGFTTRWRLRLEVPQ